MFHNGILMEAIIISVMVSIGLLLFFLAGQLVYINVFSLYCNYTKREHMKTARLLGVDQHPKVSSLVIFYS